MTERPSLCAFLRRWWNYWRLPRFKSDDEMAEWFESVDPKRLDLPDAQVAIALGAFKPKWTPESRRLANKHLLEAVLAVWDQVPDHRFGQFVMNLSRTDEGFADTWEWNHGTWHSKLANAAETWARGER